MLKILKNGRLNYDYLSRIMNETFTKIFVEYDFPICSVTLLPNLKTKKYGKDCAVYENCQIKSTQTARYKTFPLSELFQSDKKLLL